MLGKKVLFDYNLANKKFIMLKIFPASLMILVFVSLMAAQETAPKATKKTNPRPAPAPVKPKGEPFDDASVQKMAAQCVKLETEIGSIDLEMFPESAPETVRNFLNLSATGFFDGTTFSRVVPGFVVQGGNFSTRLIKPDELYTRARKNIPDEPNLIKHEPGIVSMARGEEPNSASTHFFILVGYGKHLDGKFAAFARVTKGMDVVESISKMPQVDEKPDKPVRLMKATVSPCPPPPPTPTEN